MKKKPDTSLPAAKLRRGGAPELRDLINGQEQRPMVTELYRRAEVQLQKQRKHQRAEAEVPKSAADPQRLLHELQVHQIELEMQNAELRQARDDLEVMLESFMDLYDFAPVGYFTLTAAGLINQVNLTGTNLVGIERSRLVSRFFGTLVVPAQRPVFHAFLKKVFASQTKLSLELELLGQSGKPLRAVNLEARRLLNGQECRVAVMDITERKLAEDQVRVSEIRYRRLFEAAHDGVLLLNPATRKITDANPFMTKLLGYPRAQLVGKELFEIGLLKDESASQEMFQKLKRQHEVRYEDLPLKSQTGRHQEVEVVANLYQENGHAVIQCNIRDITERKAAADALRVSEERYRNLFNSMDEGYCIIEMIFDKRQKPVDYRFLEVNPAFEKLTGLRDALGKRIREFVPDLEKYWYEIYGKVALTGEPIRVAREAKGMNRWFDIYAFRIGGNDSCKVAILFNNITERRQVAEELAEKARLLDLSHDAIIVRDMKGHIRYWNHGAEELYGWPRNAVMGKLSHRLLHTKFSVPLKQMTAELLRTDRWIGELVHQRHDGSHVTVLARKTLDRDHQGRPVAVLENITDITKRKVAEMALTRLAAIVEFSNDAIIGKTPQGIITSWNHGAEKVFGYTAREIVGASIMRLIPADRRGEEKHILKTINRGESIQHFETLRQTKDGRLIDISVTISPIKDVTGRVVGVSKVARDITERKRAEETQRRFEVLAASNKKLETEIVRRQAVEQSLKQSEKLQTRLLEEARLLQAELRHLSREVLRAQEEERKRISRELHDVIAQTLTGINLRLAGLKKMAGHNTAQFDRNVTSTQALVSKSVNIVHQFARELRPAVLDDIGLIPALHTFMKDFAKRTGLRLHLKVFAGVEKMNIAKRTALFRVAQEALTNVSRHAKASQVDVSLHKLPDDGIGMTIKDNGQSFQVERTLLANSGQRLGLLGMRERVAMVGGTFAVESAAGRGTTIQVKIPFGKTGGGGRKTQ